MGGEGWLVGALGWWAERVQWVQWGEDPASSDDNGGGRFSPLLDDV